MDCENCVYYVFDDDEECYLCLANMDEDELSRLLSGSSVCSYYRRDDEYGIVRKQN